MAPAYRPTATTTVTDTIGAHLDPKDLLDDIDEEVDEEADPADIAAGRVSYRLTYGRSAVARRFGTATLTPPTAGPTVVHVPASPITPPLAAADVAAWTGFYIDLAILEALRTGLSELHVDGRPWLNPHGPHAPALARCAHDLMVALAALPVARPTAPPASPTTSSADEAAARLDYQLVFTRYTGRRFSGDLLSGPDIDNARRPTTDARARSVGMWLDPLRELRPQLAEHGDLHTLARVPSDETDLWATSEDWVEKYVRMAVQEIVHECLEWLILDGDCWLDPHAEHEDRIRILVDGHVTALARLRDRA